MHDKELTGAQGEQYV